MYRATLNGTTAYAIADMTYLRKPLRDEGAFMDVSAVHRGWLGMLDTLRVSRRWPPRPPYPSATLNYT